jgi:homoserine O-acetyltransferase
MVSALLRTAAAALAALSLCFASEEAQKFASLGDFQLSGGGVIQDCRIGYRTFGQLNAAKSNAVLFPTWFTGTSRELEAYVGPEPGKLVDSSKFFVILVDSLANGVSSSPSNSASQPRLRFPSVTIADMVHSQRRLITEVFGIRKLYAVVGISMGGMQAFQWVVSHPHMVDRAAPIVGSPQMTSADLLLWNAELRAIQEHKDYQGGKYERLPEIQSLSLVHQFALTSPGYRAMRTPRAGFSAWLAAAAERERAKGFDLNDRVRQLEAMMAHDVGSPWNGSLARAAAEVKAKVLVVVSMQDAMVNPATALEFAQLLRTTPVRIDAPCGHLVFECAGGSVTPAVASFLREGLPRAGFFENLLK